MGVLGNQRDSLRFYDMRGFTTPARSFEPLGLPLHRMPVPGRRGLLLLSEDGK